MASYSIAFCIHGLRDPSANDNSTPIVFYQGDSSGGLAAAITAELGTATLLGWIAPIKGQVSGFGWTSDPRNPIGEGSAITVRLKDKGALLGPLFCEDPGYAVTLTWELRDNEISRTQSTIVVYGDTAPAVDNSYWINEEAVVVTAVVSSGGAHTVDIDRGACGSRARRHRLKPRTYVDGAGLLQRLYLSSRPDFDRQRFPATIWQQTIDGNTGASAITWRRGFVTSRPKPTGDAFEVVIEDFTKIMKAVVIGNGKPEVSIACSIHAVSATRQGQPNNTLGGFLGSGGLQTTVDAIGSSAASAGQGVQPGIVEFFLTLEEVEKIFGAVLHVGTEPAFDATLTSDFIDDISTGLDDVTGAAALRFLVDAGGWVGTFRLVSAELVAQGYGPAGSPQSATGLTYKLVVRAELAEVYEGTLGEDSVLQQVNQGISGVESAGLTAGFSTNENDLVPPGAEGPKLTLEWDFNPISFPLAALYWLESDQAKASDLNSAYDVLPCWAVDFDPNAFNAGSGGSPTTIDPATTEFLKLAVLQPETFTYCVRMGDRLGELLNNEALRSITLWITEPSSGSFGFRQMARAYTGGATELAREVGTPESIVKPGTRLPPINQIRVELGFMGKDRKCQDYRILALQDGLNDATNNDQLYTQTIRFWRRGTFASNSSNAAALPRLANWYFRTLRNAPAVYKQPTTIARGAHKGADFVLWSNTYLQNVRGRGFSSVVAMVVGIDNDYATGRENLLLLPYALPLLSVVNGYKAPVLVVIAVEPISAPLSWRCYVRSIGDPNLQDLVNAYGGIFANVVNDRVRIECPMSHNPSLLGKERKGKLEASATLTKVGTNASGLNWVELSFDASWQRSGAVDIGADLLVVDRARILLSDFRSAPSNVEGVDILPPEAQGPEDYAFVIYAPSEPARPWHSTYYLYR